MIIIKNHNNIWKHFFSPSPYPEGTAWVRESQFCLSLCMCVCPLLSPHTPPVQEGSSRTCVGAVHRDLSLYDIMSGIRWLLLHSNTVCCTILSVERCSLGNTSLHRDKMTPPLQEYSSVLYYTIQYFTKRFAQLKKYKARENYVVYYILMPYVCQIQIGKVHFCNSTRVQMSSQNIHTIFGWNLLWPMNKFLLYR